jgi:5-(carboxyamino)imidazole ribonucleotide synthase
MSMILPGSTLGVLGGGQLGRMFVHAAQRMGYFTAVLDKDPISPAGGAANHHILGSTDDEAALAQLMQRCAAITTEFENVRDGDAGQPACGFAKRGLRGDCTKPR